MQTTPAPSRFKAPARASPRPVFKTVPISGPRNVGPRVPVLHAQPHRIDAAGSAEIGELEALANQRDAKAKELIAYWDVGPPSYRWQEIALDEALRNSLHWAWAFRDFALMHAAIYDAMIAAWDSKYAYGRQRPSEIDATLATALPNPNSPSYPSEHAVTAGAAAAVLSYLFPDRAAYFTDKAEPEKAAELAEIKNFPRTPKTNFAAYFWEYAVGGLRSHQYWAGQVGRLIFEYRLDQDPLRAARAYALQTIAGIDAGIACWDSKYTYWAIRPYQLDPNVKPLFVVNHPSYPAAHGCHSTAEAAILGHLFPRDAAALAALAEEAAESRVWAGIHYRSDIVAGKALGRAVAEKVIARAKDDGSQ